MTDPVLDIQDKPLADALGERYLSYALSTIMARSLPDVRDGLKPVHRRLLFAMSQLRLDPDLPPKKSARVVGDVIGKFHPHGDTAVYDALVRLAQDFAVRYRLIDGQGNFGNIDGDNAAAMRYTEARLTDVARALLDGIDEDAVDFRSTYDGEGEEPVVLPASFPNLLANGASGIAVGMATSIPPHNVDEICDALDHLIRHPGASVDDLVGLLPGPDFPTGGILVEPRDSIMEAYRTGRGGFRLRARWMVEKLVQGTWQIIVTEIPYQVQKSRLVEKIAELLNARKLMLLEDVRDESAEDIRLVLVPKSRNVDPDVLMESLFRGTDLEVRIPLNMNVLDKDNVPRVMNLKEVLRAFLDHRIEVLERRSRHRLGKIDHRLEVLGGYLIAYLNLDEVIRIIREEDEPKAELMRTFTLSDVQAEAILNMRLRSLRKLEEMEIQREHDALSKERADLVELLANEARRWKTVARQLADIRKKFGKTQVFGRRRTDLADAPSAVVIPLEAMVEREPITVLLSAKGWIKAVKGHLADAGEVKYKEGDAARFVLHAETTDKLLVFATNGRFYTLAGDKLPRGRGFGEPVRLMVDLPNDADIVTVMKYEGGRRLLVAASDGRGFIVEEDEVVAQTRGGKQVVTVGEGAVAKACVPADGDHVAVIGNNRKLLVFPMEDVPVLARGRGVILQRYSDASLSDLRAFRWSEGLVWQLGDRTRTEADMSPWKGARGQVGRMPPNGFPKNNRFGE
ncbi:DNA topoisomerase IV subunit A [Arenibaculum sp.]|jgi:topoisomerase-4 subunit A|uniref:DNA topoisomerase IV subunit A n=1 Tax=Arenibaculum sp. TaxID=2865862 RepID=UPI002E1220F4|nr:DNA topoisomerase IV subunit A [Arenibaculum sp.]